MTTALMNDFHQRLARIEAGTSNNRHTLFVGMDESYFIPPKVRTAKPVTAAQNLGHGIGRLFAIALGGVGVVLILLVRFWVGLSEPTVGDALNDQMLTGIVGLLIAVLIGGRVFSDRKGLVALHSAGALFTAVGWHNLVHLAPSVFATMFSPIWAGAVLGSSDPFSIMLHGMSLSLF